MKKKLFDDLVESAKEGAEILQQEICGEACPARYKRSHEKELCNMTPGHKTPHRSKSGAVWPNKKRKKDIDG